MKRGQGAFEYVLLLAGVIMIVVIAILFLRGAFTGGAADVAQQRANCIYKLATEPVCQGDAGGGVPNNNNWNECGVVTQSQYSYSSGGQTVYCVYPGQLGGHPWCSTATDPSTYHCGPKPA